MYYTDSGNKCQSVLRDFRFFSFGSSCCSKEGLVTDTLIYAANVRELADPAVFERRFREMPSYRQEKILRLRHEKARRQSLGAGILLRLACNDLGIGGADADTVCGENGKPLFRDCPQISFSLSHSGDYALCAVSDRPVGCDIEEVRPLSPAIGERFFRPEEWALIREQPSQEERDALFFRFWVLKESYLKCTGLGFSLPMNAFSIEFRVDRIAVNRGDADADYRFFLCSRPEGYACACCIRSAEPCRTPAILWRELGGA